MDWQAKVALVAGNVRRLRDVENSICVKSVVVPFDDGASACLDVAVFRSTAVPDDAMINSQVQIVIVAPYALLTAVVYPVVVPVLDAVCPLPRRQRIIHAANDSVVGMEPSRVQPDQPDLVHVGVRDRI